MSTSAVPASGSLQELLPADAFDTPPSPPRKVHVLCRRMDKRERKWTQQEAHDEFHGTMVNIPRSMSPKQDDLLGLKRVYSLIADVVDTVRKSAREQPSGTCTAHGRRKDITAFAVANANSDFPIQVFLTVTSDWTRMLGNALDANGGVWGANELFLLSLATDLAPVPSTSSEVTVESEPNTIGDGVLGSTSHHRSWRH